MRELPFLLRIHRLLGVHRSECFEFAPEAFFERRRTASARPMSDSELARAIKEIRVRQVSERSAGKLRRR